MMITYMERLAQMYEDSLPHADPNSRNWLLLNNSPVEVWILTAAYLIFVWIGPKLMKNRKPFSLQPLMVIYNMALVLLSVYMFVEIILSAIDAGYGFFCAPYNPHQNSTKELRVSKVLWWYFFSKAIELMDTVLMILRKKMNQVTFLHVFHHATMLNIWWWVMMFIPGGLSCFGSGLNCLVHVVMYSYYGLSVIPSLKGKLWWKHYITTFQLVQFGVTLSHTLYSLKIECDFPRWGQNLLAGYMIVMLILFTNFYIHAYIIGKHRQASTSSLVKEDGKRKAMTQNGFKNGVINHGNNKKHL